MGVCEIANRPVTRDRNPSLGVFLPSPPSSGPIVLVLFQWIHSLRSSSGRVLAYHQRPTPEGHSGCRPNSASFPLLPFDSTEVPRQGFGHHPLDNRAGH